MKKRVNRFMELFWLSIAIVALVMALYMISSRGWANAWTYLLFPLLAGAMYGLRRGVRGGKGEG
jgi:uncharacterized membrane protein